VIISLTQAVEPVGGGTTIVCDTWPVQCQTYSYLHSLNWYSCTYPQRDGQAELTWVAGYIPR